METIFKIFDADKNLVINRNDITKAMKQLNLAYN
jgi:Ca2+-binding EF-hand superfamily protein